MWAPVARVGGPASFAHSRAAAHPLLERVISAAKVYRVDFKGVDSNGDVNRAGICKAAAAFANSYGGLVFVGVTANAGVADQITGVRRRGELITRLDGIVVLSADVPMFY